MSKLRHTRHGGLQTLKEEKRERIRAYGIQIWFYLEADRSDKKIPVETRVGSLISECPMLVVHHTRNQKKNVYSLHETRIKNKAFNRRNRKTTSTQ